MYRKNIVTVRGLRKRVKGEVRRVVSSLQPVPVNDTGTAVQPSGIVPTSPEGQNTTSETVVSHVEIQSLDIDFDFIDDPYERMQAVDSDTDEDSEFSDSDKDREFLQENSDPLDILSELRVWSVNNNVTHSQLRELLKVLKKFKGFEDLPVDSRTVLRTPRVNLASACSPGQYVHFGFQNHINRIKSKFPKLDTKDIKWQINIDGLPLTKSSNTQFWPILAYPSGTELSPVGIGIYCGAKKPENCNEYLNQFVNEVNGSSIPLQLFSCDSPARSYICGVKGHTAFSGCGKCTQIGKTLQNRVVFSTTTEPLRTNESFRTESDEDHHNYTSILTNIKDLDMVNDFVLDYMHLVCLGVTKKLILLWMRGNHRVFKLSSLQISEISSKLLTLKEFVCSEFSRKPRGLDDVNHWKATEFRQFLLYTGPITTKGILPADHYNLFMCLSVSITILVSSDLAELNSYAESLLKLFVRSFPVLYGEQYVSSNIHGLLHLAADSKRFGPLDNFSAFRFENYLGKLKRLVRSSNNPLAQIQRRLHETEAVSSRSESVSNKNQGVKYSHQHTNGPIMGGLTNPQYKTAKYSNFTIICGSNANGYSITKAGAFIKIVNSCFSVIEKRQVFLAVEYKRIESMFQFPCDSKLVGIFIADQRHTSDMIVFPEDIRKKCQVFPYTSNSLAVFPLIHSEATCSI